MSRVVGRPAPSQSVDFVVHLPLRNLAQLEQLTTLQGDRNSPLYHHFLTPAQFRASFGPTAQTMGKATEALRLRGLAVTKSETQLLHVRGSSAKVEAAFNTQLGIVRDSHGRTSVAAPRTLTVPSELSAIGATVAGLSLRPRPQPLSKLVPLNRKSDHGGYWFSDLKQAYQYPAYATGDGKGVTIATVGESDYNDADAALYFNHEKLGGKGALAPAPTLQRLIFPGGAPFDPTSGASDEANLDVQQSGGSAPGATIIGIDIPPGPGETFLLAYSYIDEANNIDIVSTSYGQCEFYYNIEYPFNNGVDQKGILQAYHQIFLQGNSQGITFVFSSGDNGSTDCAPPGYFGPPTGAKFATLPGPGIWVDDPNTTGVGGTNLITTYAPPSLKSTYVKEYAYSDVVTQPFDLLGTGNLLTNVHWASGGGVSTIFAKPAFQNLVQTGANMRAVPDVSMHMGGCPAYPVPVNCGKLPRSYDYAYIGGALAGLIGTSASAPEFAGLLAVKESIQKSRLGNENVDIYELAKNNNAFPFKFFHQGIPGDDGVVYVPAGRTGYNTVLGVGTPYGLNFTFTPYSAPAGDPQTATNP